MDLYGTILKPLAFRVDAETVHELALSLIADGCLAPRAYCDPSLEQQLFGVRFPNPLGLAAGFDKNGLALDRWQDLGFGFAEIGTVTREPQPGNPKPRLYRLPEHEALVNRMGFNNQGAQSLALRLKSAGPSIPIGVNLGKTKTAALKDSPKDYASSFEKLHRLGDYFVVNVSSPNTPGLRSLQEKGALQDILAAMRAIDDSRPMFVKVSPDLSVSELDDVIEVAHTARLTGIIATNTTLQRPGLRDRSEEGGLSGKPLAKLAKDVLRHLFQSCEIDMVLIGVGGISTGEDLFERIAAGAHLCQIYTGWVYGGPDTAVRMLRDFHRALNGAGLASMKELRGVGMAAPRLS